MAVSPDSPFAKALLIELDWPNVKQYADAWEKDAAHQPAMLVALGKRHLEDGKFAAAERCLKAALALAPSNRPTTNWPPSMKNRAWKTNGWRRLEEYLQRPKGPGRGPRRCPVRETIALHFIERKQWEKAEPYAEEAAKTGAGWAVLSAAACQEGLQNWDAAEEHVREAASNYSDAKTGLVLLLPADRPRRRRMPRGKWPTNSSKTSTRPPPTGLPS